MSSKDELWHNIELLAKATPSTLTSQIQLMLARQYFETKENFPGIEKYQIGSTPNLYPDSVKDWISRIEEDKGKLFLDNA